MIVGIGMVWKSIKKKRKYQRVWIAEKRKREKESKID